jgi:hypothetical protein
VCVCQEGPRTPVKRRPVGVDGVIDGTADGPELDKQRSVPDFNTDNPMHRDSVSVSVGPPSNSAIITGWGPRSMLRRIRRLLKLEAFSQEYQTLRRQLRKLLSDAATHEAPSLTATSILMRVLSMRVVSVGTPGAERTGRRLLGQFLNGRVDATRDAIKNAGVGPVLVLPSHG